MDTSNLLLVNSVFHETEAVNYVNDSCSTQESANNSGYDKDKVVDHDTEPHESEEVVYEGDSVISRPQQQTFSVISHLDIGIFMKTR